MAWWVRFLEIVLLLVLALAVAGFLSFMNLYGLFIAAVTAVVLFSVYRRQRWGYFSAAVWGLACYQLAKEGYEFADLKRQVMTCGIMVVVLAIILHEKIGRAGKKNGTDKTDLS